MHPDELEKNARLLQQSKQQLGKIVYELDKTMYLLQSEWTGVTSEKFFWDFMNIKEHVFPSTLGLLDIFQNKIKQTLSAFKTADHSEGEMLQIPDKLEPNFAAGLIDKAIGDTVTGIGETIEAFLYNPFSTLGSLGYNLTVGKIIDVGRGIGFAWDTAWGTGTARSDIEQFVNEQKKQLSEDESGYYKGAVVGQALSYFLFGKALHSKDNHGSGGSNGSGDGKKEPEKGSGKEGKGETAKIKLTEPSLPKGSKPKGNYTKGESHGIKKESETADLMADRGYDIEMLDEVNGGNGYGIIKSSNPDFLIEGEVFDCYAPTVETNVDNLVRNITKKTKTQAERIVLNLDQFPSDKVTEIYQGISRKANPNGDLKNLKELLIVKDGQIERLFGG
ncbi:hypothetical protein [Paenibacillus sp. FSL R7-0652]|uniref:CdiA C-terminal domain-containing protein n=1 Tax=Paenibacillus sp. FSL R7-0652 TaxID=2921687 RepID=UPI00315AA825